MASILWTKANREERGGEHFLLEAKEAFPSLLSNPTLQRANEMLVRPLKHAPPHPYNEGYLISEKARTKRLSSGKKREALVA